MKLLVGVRVMVRNVYPGTGPIGQGTDEKRAGNSNFGCCFGQCFGFVWLPGGALCNLLVPGGNLVVPGGTRMLPGGLPGGYGAPDERFRKFGKSCFWPSDA